MKGSILLNSKSSLRLKSSCLNPNLKNMCFKQILKMQTPQGKQTLLMPHLSFPLKVINKVTIVSRPTLLHIGMFMKYTDSNTHTLYLYKAIKNQTKKKTESSAMWKKRQTREIYLLRKHQVKTSNILSLQNFCTTLYLRALNSINKKKNPRNCNSQLKV